MISHQASFQKTIESFLIDFEKSKPRSLYHADSDPTSAARKHMQFSPRPFDAGIRSIYSLGSVQSSAASHIRAPQPISFSKHIWTSVSTFSITGKALENAKTSRVLFSDSNTHGFMLRKVSGSYEAFEGIREKTDWRRHEF